MNKNTFHIALIAALSLAWPAGAQAQTQEQPKQPNATFESAAASAQKQLADSLAELTALRDRMVEEKLPLSRTLSELENELSDVRAEYQQVSRLVDNRTLDLNNLRNEIKARQEEATYLSNLLSEYIRNFESRLHIAELQRYREGLDAAKLAPENSNLSEQQVFETQVALLSASVERLHDALGGTRFEGAAVDSGGLVQRGTFVLLGPVALFRSADGEHVGTVEQRLGSLEPAIIAFQNPADAQAAAQVVTFSKGDLPLDPTLGNAHKIESTNETFIEHVQKGGPVMYPIFGLAGIALLVALCKFISLSLVRRPSAKQMKALLAAIAQRNRDAAMREAKAMPGPAGKMLFTGVEHLEEPRELIEEVMYEKVLSARLKLQSWLPFIAITASSAPLLGLLGTVTGIMNTFTLMTVFGTGDVKTLSGGISEALITTEFGLYVAIPSLLLYAFLSRRARAIIDDMEKKGVSLVNQVGKTPLRRPAVAPRADDSTALSIGPDPEDARDQTADQVRAILADMLRPLVRAESSEAGPRTKKAKPVGSASALSTVDRDE